MSAAADAKGMMAAFINEVQDLLQGQVLFFSDHYRQMKSI